MPFEIRPTTYYERLVPFFIENGLEFSEEDEVPTDIVACYLAEYPEASQSSPARIAGAAVLALREGEYICDGIATDAGARGAGLGKELLETLISDVRSRGGASLYLVARAPAFFAKHGFVPIPRTEAPSFFECFTCPQYKKTCFPEVMKLSFHGENHDIIFE
jgi:N-acetylglutamate synthase-like GNAT family acetyltransferase